MEPIISKQLFLESKDKHSILKACMDAFIMVDDYYKKQQYLVKEGDATERQGRLGHEGASQDISEKVVRIRHEMEAYKADIASKEAKFHTYESYVQEEMRYCEADHNALEQLNREYLRLREGIYAEINKKHQQIATLQAELEQCTSIVAATHKIHRRNQGLLQPESIQMETIYRQLQEKVPAAVICSGSQAMEKFDIQKLSQQAPGYIAQCKVGKMGFLLSQGTQKELQLRYPELVSDQSIALPYLQERACPPKQIFLYDSQGIDAAWEHFQSLCLSRLILQKKRGGELYAITPSGKPFLEGFQEYTEGAVTMVQRGNIPDFLDYIKEQCIVITRKYFKQYHTIEAYNKANPRNRLRYKNIAFFNFAGDLGYSSYQTINSLLSDAIACGYHFLFLGNREDLPEENSMDGAKTFAEIAKMAESYQTLCYAVADKRYYDMENPYLYYEIY